MRLDVPVACTLGEDCLVQNYLDHDPGPGRADFACGLLSYDGHDGTDIRTLTLAQMREGVAVLAAAPGRVIAVRDGEPDVNVNVIGRDAVAGKEAGNAVRIAHGDGWETQYSHLREGSVRVRPGEVVQAGQVIGQIGLSGFTEFPHLEFAVRRDGDHIDPFVGLVEDFACGGERSPLWTPTADAALAYRPTGLLQAGFADQAPDRAAAARGQYDGIALAADRPIVLWYEAMGVKAGDRQRLRLSGPQGAILDADTVLEADKVVWFAFGGRRAPEGGWPAGTYRADITLSRDGAILFAAEQQADVPATERRIPGD